MRIRREMHRGFLFLLNRLSNADVSEAEKSNVWDMANQKQP